MNQQEALEIISGSMYASYEELRDGLPNGPDDEWCYDEQLVIEVAEAVLRWQSRLNPIKDPYTVWFFDGVIWSKMTKDKYQEEAYKDWYHLTQGGTVMHNSTCPTYFLLGSSNLKLEGRHLAEEFQEEDNFSISYLLNKSFG